MLDLLTDRIAPSQTPHPVLPAGCAAIDDSVPSLLDFLLGQQQSLSAVERFCADQRRTVPDQSQYYARLLPASPPQPGQQYAFEVDLDCCSGCKACVVACHSLNGLDEQETWRDVGLLIGGTSAAPVMQHVTTACHHCLEPACMAACPVDAYEKHPVTGIVKHLDDQCFGCQYCTLACPYDVPKFHAAKGIVRKCDLCADRLAVGEAPACVQACPHEAIAIRVVSVEQVRENAEADPFLPAAPEPHLTFPTTTYKTSRVFPRNLLPADYYSLSPQQPHWPLIIMLVLTQLSVGAFAVGLWLEYAIDPRHLAHFRPLHGLLSLGFGLVALAASTMHLGRPQYAFRAVIGLKHSWLSREIAAFGGFTLAAVASACAVWIPGVPAKFARLAADATVLCGALGVFCSVMIYVFTRRECWSFVSTSIKFTLTAAILGIAASWLSLLLIGRWIDAPVAAAVSQQAGPQLIAALMAASLAKLLFEASIFRHLLTARNTPLHRSARLLAGPLSSSTFARFAAGLLGGIVMPAFLREQLTAADMHSLTATVAVGMIFAACLIGELLERRQFFAAATAPRMPGGVRP